VWRPLNVALVILGLWGGYSSLDPDYLRQTNPDVVLCAAIIIALPLVSILGVYYGLKRLGLETLQRPSWNRFPLKFWFDPLEFIFIAKWLSLAAAVGGSMRLFLVGMSGFWTVALSWSFAIGLLVGERLIYILFRNRIASA
jgi:hypothetical protein